MYLAEPLTIDAARGATEQATEQVRRFLLCLTSGPPGRQEAMHGPGLGHRPTFLYDYLQPALRAGFAEMTRPDAPTSPTQKYRLTAKGRAVVAAEKRSDRFFIRPKKEV